LAIVRFLVFALLCANTTTGIAKAGADESERWRLHAAHVRIVRDNWGIAHIYGKSDADTVFGAMYAQSEDDFGRIERNYLNGLGVLAQAEGESAIYSDLRQRLFIDPSRLQRLYRHSPIWLKTLMLAWSDGLNYFLQKHPDVTPKVIHHFEPWMALSFTEGSIGGDIESIDLGKLREFYDQRPAPSARQASSFGSAPAPIAEAGTAAQPFPGGSNGFAIAPSRSASGHALLWINPHTSYYFRAENGRWIAIKLLQNPVPALAQSYLRTKTTDYASFRKTQEMRTDTSNNTVYADADGTIAYFHGNFIPKRDPAFDFIHPVDGSDPATEWHGAHSLKDTITLLNPASGWIQNTNNWPFSAAGAASPKREEYPAYMWIKGENPRGIHAVEVLSHIHDVTLDSLIAAGYDSHLTAFDVLLPPLFEDYDRLATDDARRGALKDPITSLRSWDRRTLADSVPTALAIFWGQAMLERKGPEARDADEPLYDYLVGPLTATERLDALAAAVAKLQSDFGRWQTPWGEINRYQRLTDDIVQPVDDAKPSLPVGFASSNWGALASFDTTYPRKTKKIYGSVGNSFVAAVKAATHHHPILPIKRKCSPRDDSVMCSLAPRTYWLMLSAAIGLEASPRPCGAAVMYTHHRQ